MRLFPACPTLLLLVALTACTSPDKLPATALPPAPQLGFTVTPSGLGILDLKEGEGASPRLAQNCTVEVLGWIETDGKRGKSILDTRKRGYPATFPIGVGRVIPGWDEGIATMKKGGRRLLRVPPSLGYSRREAREDIPADATLLFEVDLIDIR